MAVTTRQEEFLTAYHAFAKWTPTESSAQLQETVPAAFLVMAAQRPMPKFIVMLINLMALLWMDWGIFF